MTDLFSPFAREAVPSELTAETLTRRLQGHLEALSPEQVARIFSSAEEFREEDGAYLGGGEETPVGQVEENGVDLMPFVLDGEEWARLETGLTQRLRAWNCFLRDIYTSQEILKAGVVPYELVFSDPNFSRGCARLKAAIPHYLQLTAFDLQRTRQGQWMVVENHLSVAEGATYALKKRQVMRQIAPRLFEGVEILPIEDFSIQVMDVLQAWVRKSEGRARAVLLSRGSRDEHYLDQATLARQMGVSIVQGSDLVVLDSRLYLKTIAGMDRVDVVLRRLPTSQLDPVTFDGRSRVGVPGLLSCVRKGELAMANGMGSDLADNRALAAHLPAIIEYYTGEKALLASPQILELRDIDVREEVAENRDRYIVRHAWKRGLAHQWILRDIAAADWIELWDQVEAAPQEYVVHRALPSESFPAWNATGADEQPVTLRVFGLGEHRISPCVLGWTGSGSPPTPAMMQANERLKDVWILRPPRTQSVDIFTRQSDEARRLRLTSRVAESFFWMGRYAERAEVVTRALRIMQTVAWPRYQTPRSRRRQPLWAAMARISGHKPDFFLQNTITREEDLPFYFLFNREHPRSVLSSLQGWRQNAENIREHFPPEVWSVLNRLYLQVALQAEDTLTPAVRLGVEDGSLHQEILTQLDELTGALGKHMLHDDAWHFWQLGVYAERSLMTLLALQQVVSRDGDPAGLSGTSNLDLLLQMLAGQYAYRSLYHARPVAARTAALLLQDEVFPRSVLFCLHRMRRALAATLGENFGRGADTPLKHYNLVVAELSGIALDSYFRASLGGAFASDDLSDIPRPEFSVKLEEMIDLVHEGNSLVSDHYLNHQVTIREPELFDLGA